MSVVHVEPLHGWSTLRPNTPRVGAWLTEWLECVAEHVRDAHSDAASPPLQNRERLLSAAWDVDGRPIVATDRALYYQPAQTASTVDEREWVRMPWELIGSVSWNRDDDSLTLTPLVPAVSQRTVLRIPDGATIELLARERVESTMLIQTRIDLGEHGQARVLARRAPGTQHLVWVVALDDGVDPDAPTVRAAVDAALTLMRAGAGLPPPTAAMDQR